MNGFRLFARVVWLAVVLGFSFAPSARAATIALVDEEKTARPAPSVNNTAYAYPSSSSGLAYIGRSATKEHFHEFLVVADDGSNQAKELGLHKFTYEDTSKGAQDTRLFHRTPSTDAQLNADHVQLEKTYDLEDCAFDPGSGNVWAVNEVGSGSTIPANTIREYNRTTGKIVREVTVPTIITTKARGNFGLESLTISGDGLTMWTCNEEALTCDGNRSSPTESTTVRLVKFTRATTADNFALAGMYAYTVPHWEHPSGGQGVNSQRGGVSGLCALPDGTLLVLERELSNDYFVIRICKADVSQATDIRDNAGLASTTGWTAAKRTQLMRHETGGTAASLLSKAFYNYEGICLGPRVPSGRHLLALIADAGDGFSGRQTMFVPISGLSTVEMDIDAPPVGCAATYAGTFFRFEKDRSLTMRVSGLGSLGSGKTLRWHLPNCTPSSGLVAADGTATITPNADDHLTWEVVDAVSAAHEHAWSAWTTTTPATCTATGTETRTCAAAGCDVPGAKETRTLAALGHAPVDDPAVAATCKAAGLTAGSHCSRCGATIVAQASVPKAAHSYVNGICTVCHASSSCHAVTVAVKDWAGKTLATVKGVTYDGTFSLDAKDYFTTDHAIDYVTAFDGGVVSASPDTKTYMSGSKVTWSNLTTDLDTEIFVQPFAPIVPRRTDGPDPWCIKDPTTSSDYWVYTYTTGGSVGLYRTTTFDNFNSVPANLNHLASGYASNVWAPEVHYIDGNWYVYFSASTSSGSDTERSFVMSYKGSNASGLTTASNWQTATRLVTPDDKWAIDGTVFKANGQLYYVWSGWPGDRNVQQNIYLAPLATPTSFVEGATRTLVSAPTEAWEKHDSPIVNEGPAVLQRNGKVTIVYSGSGSWTQYYALGYATCSDGNFTNPASWKKHLGAVFSSRSTANAPTWAPGHCSFTQDADGRDYIVYHAQASYDYGTGKWSWPGQWKDRGIRTQPFAWHDEEPVFGVPRPTATSEPWDYATLDYTGSGFETRTIVRPPTTATVTLGSPNTIDIDGGDVFTVEGVSSLKAAGTGKVTLRLADGANYVWAGDDAVLAIKSLTVSVVDPSATGGGDEPEPEPVVEGGDWGYKVRNIGVTGADVAVVFTNASKAIEWTVPADVTRVRYLVVAGGGSGAAGGANLYGGGGGAGGVLMGESLAVAPKAKLTITVGGGGAGVNGASTGHSANGNKGGDSTVFAGGAELLRASGGGYGGGYDSNTKVRQVGGEGGSGGGGGPGGGTTYSVAGGPGVAGQGYAGGESSYIEKRSGSGGGAGGEGCAGGTGGANGAGYNWRPGPGVVSDITGRAVTYACGGLGGALVAPGAGADGTDGLGNGGGGGSGARNRSGKGGNGIVVLRYDGGGDPACPHSAGTVSIVQGRAATCTTEGLTAGERCAACGKVLAYPTAIPPLGHQFSNGRCTRCSCHFYEADEDRPGDIVLSSYWQDHMILQRDKPITVWGRNRAGRNVSVTFAGQTATATTDASGLWVATFAEPFAVSSAGRTLAVYDTEYNVVHVRDVLVGDVFLAGGQSNMDMRLDEDAKAVQNYCVNDDGIRVRRVQRYNKGTVESTFDLPENLYYPKSDTAPLVSGYLYGRSWGSCAEETNTLYMSSLAMIVARGLRDANPDIPIGIVQVSSGGTAIREHLAASALAAAGYKPASGDSAIWNNMIAPITRAVFCGVLWYQGESDAYHKDEEEASFQERAANYAALMRVLVSDWRSRWGANLPFYAVQVATHGNSSAVACDKQYPAPTTMQSLANYAPIREAQRIWEIGETGPHDLTVICDAVYFKLHPAGKDFIGKRMVLPILRDLYGSAAQAVGPKFDRAALQSDGSVRVSFKSGTATGLTAGAVVPTSLDRANPTLSRWEARPDEPIKGFALCGADGVWKAATATVVGNAVVLRADGVSNPTQFHYGCWSVPQPGETELDQRISLYNGAGLPLSPIGPQVISSGGDDPEPVCDHQGFVVTDAAVAATCTATGLTEGSHCSNCGAVLVARQQVAALGHDWDAGVVTTEPTETTDGVKTFTCRRPGCGATKTETIPATGGGDEPGPTPVVVGEWGYELTLAGGDVVRVYTNTSGTIEWTVPSGVTSVRYLVVGGGGGGASGGTGIYGGGGGAGGLLAGDGLSVSGTLRITVGAGGESVAGSRSGSSGNGNPGKASTVFAGETELLRAYGGGYGGGYVDKARQVGGDGGSGGGGGPAGGTSASMAGGKGVEGQGVDGGASSKDDARAGNGGGLSFSSNITGTSVTYAVGGAGGELAMPGAGADGADGTGNGGAGGSGASNASGKGGDGVVILRYSPTGGGDDPEPTCDHEGTIVTDAAVPAICTATGLTEGSHCSKCGAVIVAQQEIPALGHDWDEGVVTTEPTATTDGVRTFTCQRQGCGETKTERIPATGGGDEPEPPVVVGEDWGYELTLAGGDVVRVYTNTSGAIEWTVPSGVSSVRYLVVGGGGGGGGKSPYGGGGGAGGMKDDVQAVASGDQLVIRVGAGGAGATSESVSANGEASSISRNGAALVTVAGGGAGGCGGVGSEGACGGGGAKSQKGGKGTLGYWGYKGTSGGGGAGGGGMGGGSLTGDDSYPEGGNVGTPGLGLASEITGESVTYAAGGAGGSLNGPAPAAGADGTGNGGGGAKKNQTDGFKGGDGVVILRYTPAGGGDDPEPGTIRPSEGESSVTVTADTVTAAAEAALKLIEPPTGVEITSAAYAGYFKASEVKSAGEGKWSVTVALDPEMVTPEIVATDDQPAVTVGPDGELTLNVQVKPGLYYGVKAAATLEALMSAKPVMQSQPATAEGTLQLKASKPAAGANAQFSRVVVSASRDGK